MAESGPAMSRVRTPRRDGDDQRHAVQPRETQEDWWWAWVVARQMARLPAGRQVTRWEAFEEDDVSVLCDKRKGNVA